MYTAFTHIAYFAVVTLLICMVPEGFVGQHAAEANTIFILGILGTWRYTWAGTNFVRAVYFRFYAYPRRKAKAFARFNAHKRPAHAYFLVTTYMVKPEDTIKCYRALFLAASKARDGATIVASVVDGADERLVKEIWSSSRHDLSRVQLIIDRIKSNGKRDALAKTLHIIGQFAPGPDDILVFVDGDTCVPEDVVSQSAPIFSDPKVGALTTDEGVILDDDNLFKDWFILRFNQRQVMMCSTGLARRVLTLTGRMSVFRAELATRKDFIEQVANDYLNHWRLGTVKFLTGDDKSTWFWLLKNGYTMEYLPDVQSQSMETQPEKSFYRSSKTLMVRWFGNMMRTNGRALKLSPMKIGFFTWWSILDQRVSMWTTLVGPISVALTAWFIDLTIIPLYIAWVMMTRYIFCVIINVFNGSWFPVTHPPILYFGQIAGAIVKTFVMFRLDKQRWTRQGAGTVKVALDFRKRLPAIEATLHQTLAFMWLTIGVVILMQL